MGLSLAAQCSRGIKGNLDPAVQMPYLHRVVGNEFWERRGHSAGGVQLEFDRK